MQKNRIAEVSSGTQRQLKRSYLDTEPPLDTSKPSGPFRMAAEAHAGDLLLFVPRNEVSRLINSLTGKYGYSHLAIDCGEVDEPSGRRVMVEATVQAGVHYGFQDEYGPRAYVRIPLHHAGVDIQQFCRCVRAHVGNKFDDLEAITLGILDNPARQICSDLVTVCLPEEMCEKIMLYHRRAIIHPLAAARDKEPGRGVRLFMSPNGFAEFLGAPHGDELAGPDQLAEPHLQESSREGLVSQAWKWSDTLLTTAWRSLTHR
jgi:hypothetical protein